MKPIVGKRLLSCANIWAMRLLLSATHGQHRIMKGKYGLARMVSGSTNSRSYGVRFCPRLRIGCWCRFVFLLRIRLYRNGWVCFEKFDSQYGHMEEPASWLVLAVDALGRRWLVDLLADQERDYVDLVRRIDHGM